MDRLITVKEYNQLRHDAYNNDENPETYEYYFKEHMKFYARNKKYIRYENEKFYFDEDKIDINDYMPSEGSSLIKVSSDQNNSESMLNIVSNRIEENNRVMRVFIDELNRAWGNLPEERVGIVYDRFINEMTIREVMNKHKINRRTMYQAFDDYIKQYNRSYCIEVWPPRCMMEDMIDNINEQWRQELAEIKRLKEDK